MMEYKGYVGVVEFDPEIEMFTGYVADLRDEIYFEGASVDEIKDSMHRAVDQYLDVCRQRSENPDKPFSGRFNVRLDPSLHRLVAIASGSDHMSMNDWVVEAIQEHLPERTVSHVARKERPAAKSASGKRAVEKRPQEATMRPVARQRHRLAQSSATERAIEERLQPAATNTAARKRKTRNELSSTRDR
jgi:predicted HicB family RNase H-like nuclease